MSEEEEIETGTPTAASSSGLIYVFLLTLPACPSPHPGLPSAQPAHPASSAVISGLPGYGGTQGGDSESLSSGRTTASLDAEGEARVGTACGTQGGPMVGLPCMLLNEERGPCLLHSRSPRPPIRQLHPPMEPLLAVCALPSFPILSHLHCVDPRRNRVSDAPHGMHRMRGRPPGQPRDWRGPELPDQLAGLSTVARHCAAAPLGACFSREAARDRVCVCVGGGDVAAVLH